MIRFFFTSFLVLLSACSVPEPEISELSPSYTVSFGYNNQNEPRLKVDISMRMPASGIALEFPGKYSAKKSDLIEYIEDFIITSNNARLDDSNNKKYKILSASPGTLVNFSYLVRSYGLYSPKVESFNAPVISEEYVSFVGSMVFVVPLLKEWEQQMRIELNWQLPPNFSMFNSYGEAYRKQVVHTSLNRLREAIFVGGTELRLIKNSIHDKPVTLALMGQWEYISDNAWETLSMKLLNTQRSTWQDFNFSHYLISLWAYGKSCQENKTLIKYQGKAHYNAVRSKFGPACPLTIQQKQLLSHEFMHAWFGYIIKLSGNAEGRWLTEGWTDYYGWIMALRAQVITLQDYFEGINSDFISYQNSPNNKITLDEFKKYYSDNKASDDMLQMPYWQGHIMALRLNKIIKERSNFTRSLDDAVRDLLVLVKENSLKALSITQISTAIDNYAGDGIFQREYGTIVNGKFLELPNLDGCADLVRTKQNNIIYKITNINGCNRWLN